MHPVMLQSDAMLLSANRLQLAAVHTVEAVEHAAHYGLPAKAVAPCTEVLFSE
jgi:hypothetical protein